MKSVEERAKYDDYEMLDEKEDWVLRKKCFSLVMGIGIIRFVEKLLLQ